MNDLLFGKWLLWAAVCSLFTACQAIPEEEIPMTDAVASLSVKARTAEDTDLVYPLCLLVFSKVSGECVENRMVEHADEVIQLQLSEGNYRIVALSGLSEDYHIPEKPALEDEIVLQGAWGASTALMIGKADVSVASSSDITLNVVLSYVVSAVRVKLTNLPSDVTGVSLSLSPLYRSVSINGKYGGEGESLRMECEKDSDGTWCSETRYVFPGSASETLFSVVLKKSDGSEMAYGYTYSGAPQAKRPFNIIGNYSGGMVVDGSFTIEGWGEATDVEFEFGASVQPDGENKDEGVDWSRVPEVGSVWRGSIVASVGEADAAGVDLLLLSLDEWDATTADVDELMGWYQVGDISDWRLPTYTEARLLRSKYSGENRLALNERIAAYDSELYEISGTERYLCRKDNAFYSFIFAEGTSMTEAGFKRTYYTRLVKSYRLIL